MNVLGHDLDEYKNSVTIGVHRPMNDQLRALHAQVQALKERLDKIGSISPLDFFFF
jgi:hypothetical protein